MVETDLFKNRISEPTTRRKLKPTVCWFKKRSKRVGISKFDGKAVGEKADLKF